MRMMKLRKRVKEVLGYDCSFRFKGEKGVMIVAPLSLRLL